LGQTLRAFQPTIREVVEVSQDLKGTLEKVGLWLTFATNYMQPDLADWGGYSNMQLRQTCGHDKVPTSMTSEEHRHCCVSGAIFNSTLFLDIMFCIWGFQRLGIHARGHGGWWRGWSQFELSHHVAHHLQELGLDEIRASAQAPPRPKSPPTTSTSLASASASVAADEEDEDIEAKRKASAAMAWGGAVPAASTASTSSTDSGAPAAAASSSTNGGQQAASPAPAAPANDLAGLSMEQLEAELARRRAAAAGSSSGAGKA
jgi:hypothetical protein